MAIIYNLQEALNNPKSLDNSQLEILLLHLKDSRINNKSNIIYNKIRQVKRIIKLRLTLKHE